jgi:hypothetical protein
MISISFALYILQLSHPFVRDVGCGYRTSSRLNQNCGLSQLTVRDPVKVHPYWFVPWGSLNAVRKYVSSQATSKGLYLSRIGIYKVIYKVKNKGIRVRRRILRVSGV